MQGEVVPVRASICPLVMRRGGEGEDDEEDASESLLASNSEKVGREGKGEAR